MEIDPVTMGVAVVGLLAFFWLVGTVRDRVRRRPGRRPTQEVDNGWPGQGSDSDSGGGAD